MFSNHLPKCVTFIFIKSTSLDLIKLKMLFLIMCLIQVGFVGLCLNPSTVGG